MERVKALEPAPQNFLIGYSFLRPALEHPIDPDALVALEFIVIKIGIVNHFSDLVDGFVLDSEPFEQCLECAVFSVVREFSVEHVE